MKTVLLFLVVLVSGCSTVHYACTDDEREGCYTDGVVHQCSEEYDEAKCSSQREPSFIPKGLELE